MMRFISSAAILLGLINVAAGANIPIVNPSFETDVLTCTAGASCVGPTQPPTGWTVAIAGPTGFGSYGFYGEYKPGTVQYPSGVPDGVNVAYISTGVYSNALSQTLTSTLQANDTYTLTFYVGLRADPSVQNPALGCSSFNVSLLAGGNLLTSLLLADGNASCSVVSIGSFTKLSFTYSSGSSPNGLGLPLQIALTANGSGNQSLPSEIDFDDITLTDTTGSGSQSYYFSDLAFSGGYKTTLTYINYSPQTVTCVTNFYSDAGTPLPIPFTQGAITTRTDILAPGASIHDQTIASLTAAVVEGWAQASCTGPIQASLLYRLYNTSSGAAIGEASVNAETTPTTEFVTFAQTATGVAYANPSTNLSAAITFEVYNASGLSLGSSILTLGPLAHGSANVGPVLGLSSFTGFVKITSTIPIIALSLNAEAFPVFSSLPPGDLPSGTTLVTP